MEKEEERGEERREERGNMTDYERSFRMKSLPRIKISLRRVSRLSESSSTNCASCSCRNCKRPMMSSTTTRKVSENTMRFVFACCLFRYSVCFLRMLFSSTIFFQDHLQILQDRKRLAVNQAALEIELMMTRERVEKLQVK